MLVYCREMEISGQLEPKFRHVAPRLNQNLAVFLWHGSCAYICMKAINKSPEHDGQTIVTSMSVFTGTDGDAVTSIFTTMSIEYTREPVSHASVSASGDDAIPRRV